MTVETGDATEVAHRAAAAMYAADEASRAVGITVDDVGPGRATARMTVRPSMVNGHGVIHGGYVFLLADTAFAFACNTHGDVAVAAGAQITFVAPAFVGDALVAVAVERARYGRNGIADVTVRRGGDLIAEFRGQSRVVPARGPSGRP